MDALENIRGFWGDMLGLEEEGATVDTVKKNLDGLFQHVFTSEGKKGGEMSAEQISLIEAVSKSKKDFEWADFRSTVKWIVTDYEKPMNDSHFVKDG